MKRVLSISDKSIFICGTDTNVGKTVVTGALISLFKANGECVAGFKPLESGCKKGVPQDAQFLNGCAGNPEPLSEICLYRFKEALAPGVAASRKGVSISFPKIKNQLLKLQKKYDRILIEGAGGLLVPISGKKTNLELIQFLKTPVILVARLGLGTINHTLLTLEHFKRNRVKVLGVILNETVPAQSLAEKTNVAVLKKLGVPILGVFPHLK